MAARSAPVGASCAFCSGVADCANANDPVNRTIKHTQNARMNAPLMATNLRLRTAIALDDDQIEPGERLEHRRVCRRIGLMALFVVHLDTSDPIGLGHGT